MALAWNLGRATRLRRAGVVSERTSVGGPDKERITSRRGERARGHRFLRSLGEEWRVTQTLEMVYTEQNVIPG